MQPPTRCMLCYNPNKPGLQGIPQHAITPKFYAPKAQADGATRLSKFTCNLQSVACIIKAKNPNKASLQGIPQHAISLPIACVQNRNKQALVISKITRSPMAHATSQLLHGIISLSSPSCWPMQLHQKNQSHHCCFRASADHHVESSPNTGADKHHQLAAHQIR